MSPDRNPRGELVKLWPAWVSDKVPVMLKHEQGGMAGKLAKWHRALAAAVPSLRVDYPIDGGQALHAGARGDSTQQIVSTPVCMPNIRLELVWV